MSARMWVKRLGYIAFVVFLFLVPSIISSPYYLSILVMCGINIILATSLRVLYNCGELSLAHGGMMLVGAYTSGLLMVKLGLSSWVALLAGGVATMLLALLVGYPFFRLKGIYFALVTAFLSEVVTLVGKQWSSLTGGTMGITGIPGPDPLAVPLLRHVDFSMPDGSYYVVLFLVLVVLLILYAIETSHTHTTWVSIRESDDLATSVGVNINNYKVLAFCISCFFAGIAGAFYSQFMGIVVPTAFGFTYSIYVIVYLVVGGAKRFMGPILGALVLTLVPEVVRGLRGFVPYVFAAVMLLVVVFMPEGMAGIPSLLGRMFKERRKHA